MRLFDRVFARIVREGELTAIDCRGGLHKYGIPAPGRAPVVMRFTDRATPSRILADPSLGAGEAYMDGRLVMEEGGILDLLDLITWNSRFEKRGDIANMTKRRNPVKDAIGVLRTLNQERRARRNVAHHYDLSGKLYDLFLDEDRQYSCAYFTDPGNSLEQAQADKKAHIAAKLAIAPGMRVLDIGCGWGGLALYVNAKTGADVTGITLSEEQLAVARRRAADAGVGDRVRFELVDYRAVQGRFDRIVSVGMFEHVGPAHYRIFMAKCRSLLADDGVMLLHTIGRMGTRRPTDRFTTKYIFPGGYVPTLSEMAAAAESARLIQADVETLRLHYALTLDHWLRRAQANRAAIEAMYDSRFYRMWEYYLAGSLCGFTNSQMVNYQVQYIRDRRALPITRDYIGRAERALKGNEAMTGQGAAKQGWNLGNRIAPPRFLTFLAIELIASPIGIALLGWRVGTMASFDLAALVFLAIAYPLLNDETDQMRAAAKRNDANRLGLLVITSVVTLTILVAVASELSQKGAPKPPVVILIVTTLALAWTFSNTIYALHYAHLFYSSGKEGDCGGLDFPKTPEPDYWDFVYFSFCLGMTFQTSDVEMTDRRFRRAATAHCLAAFVFNLGVLAFTINVLGGG